MKQLVHHTYDLHRSIHFIKHIGLSLDTLKVKVVGTNPRPFHLKELMYTINPNIFILLSLKTEDISQDRADIFCSYNYSIMQDGEIMDSERRYLLPSYFEHYWESIRAKLCICNRDQICINPKHVNFYDVKTTVDANIKK